VFITETITADIHQNLQAHQVNQVQYSQIKCGSPRLAGSLKPGHAVWQRDTEMLCQTNEFASVSRPDLILLHLIQIHVSAISETHCSPFLQGNSIRMNTLWFLQDSIRHSH